MLDLLDLLTHIHERLLRKIHATFYVFSHMTPDCLAVVHPFNHNPVWNFLLSTLDFIVKYIVMIKFPDLLLCSWANHIIDPLMVK